MTSPMSLTATRQTRRLPVLCWAAALLMPTVAQGAIQVSAQVAGVATPVSAGGVVNLQSTAVGRDTIATITLQNTGSAPVTISLISLTGSSDLSLLSGSVALPLTIASNATASFNLRYLPASGQRASSQLLINYSDTSGGAVFQFGVSGSTPDVVFSYFLQPDGAVNPLVNGGRISFPATNLSTSRGATVVVTNRGSAPSTFRSAAIAGAGFQISGLATLPATIPAGQDLRFTVSFTPQVRGTAVGSLGLSFDELSVLLAVDGLGASADFALSYVLAADGSSRQLSNGGQITFLATNVNATALANVAMTNLGTAPGSVLAVSLSGSGFQLANVPTLPANVPGGADFRFSVVFAPTSSGSSTGLLTITLADRTLQVFLAGSTTASNLTVNYFLASDNNFRPLSNGGALTFPATSLNANALATVVVGNQGGSIGQVSAVSVSGASFQLVSLPALPASVDVGRDLRFGVLFAPTTAGTFTGLLTITLADRTLQVSLAGSTTASNLTINYFLATDSNFRPLLNGGTVSFPATSLSATLQATVVIANQGGGSGQITGVSLSGASFQLVGLPTLPANVDAGRDLRFGILFAPRQAGNFSGTLRIDFQDRSVLATLSGTAATADYTISYVLSDGNTRQLPNGASLSFLPVAVTTNAQATVTIANVGTGAGIINSIAVTGNGFQMSGAPVFPALVEVGRAVQFTVQFAPRQLGSYNGALQIEFNDKTFSATLNASTSLPDFAVAYQDATTTVPVANLGTIVFANTTVATVSTVSVTITNNGTGLGFLNNLRLTGAAFQLAETVGLPASIDGGRSLRFTVRYAPTEQQRYSGALVLEFSDKTVNLSLDGLGVGPIFIYETVSADGTVSPAPAAQALSFGETPLGQNSTLVLQVRNAGAVDGTLSAVGVTGTGFQIADLPILPLTLKVNESQRITLRFTATQPGDVTGRLRIGNDNFNLQALATGPLLVFAATVGTVTTALDTTNGGIVFASARVGEQSSAIVAIENRGNRPAVLNGINLTAPSTVFTLSGVPTLPVTLEVGNRVQFQILFVPNSTTTATATFRVNTATFALSGTGDSPATLPAFQFTGLSSGTQEALQQPTFGLALSAAYPLTLRGTVTLSFISDTFTANPSVQFASGGRTVNFTIPSGSTQALFDGNTALARLQTGTVSGRILLTPTIATQGGLDLTPAAPPVLTLTINSSVPRLIDATLTGRSLSSLSISLTGYTTTRSLRQVDIQFTPRPGQNVATSKLTINIETSSLTWFQSASSDAFGGLFSLSVPLAFSGGNLNEDLVSRFQSLTITISNQVGASSVLTLNIP